MSEVHCLAGFFLYPQICQRVEGKCSQEMRMAAYVVSFGFSHLCKGFVSTSRVPLS